MAKAKKVKVKKEEKKSVSFIPDWEKGSLKDVDEKAADKMAKIWGWE